jgi:hypothetical protein
MHNLWLQMDAIVLQKKRKRKIADAAMKKQRDSKQQQLQQSRQPPYQTAINKCMISKQLLTSTDYAAKSNSKRRFPYKKGKQELISQLHCGFNYLQQFLPS